MAKTYNLKLTEHEVEFLRTSLQTAISFNKVAMNWSKKELADKATDHLITLRGLENKVNKVTNIINDDAN